MDAKKPVAPKWFTTRLEENREEIFDPVRRKYVALTPEEEVRQKMMHFLVHKIGVPVGLMAVEFQIRLKSLTKRCDIVIFSRKGVPLMIVECKAATVRLDQKAIEQAAIYNTRLNVNFLTITNSFKTYCCALNKGTPGFKLLGEIPAYNIMCEAADKHDGKSTQQLP